MRSSATGIGLVRVLLLVLLSVHGTRGVQRFFHISDFHYDPLYEATGTPDHHSCRRAGSLPGDYAARPFGQYGCDAPMSLVSSSYVHSRFSVEKF